MIEFSRYTIASILAFLVDFLLLFVLTESGLMFLISAAIAFSFGVVTKYLLCINYVFDSRKIKNNFHEFLIYATIAFSGLFVNQLSMFVFVNFFMFYYLFGKLFTSFLVYLSTYLLKKKILF